MKIPPFFKTWSLAHSQNLRILITCFHSEGDQGVGEGFEFMIHVHCSLKALKAFNLVRCYS